MKPDTILQRLRDEIASAITTAVGIAIWIGFSKLPPESSNPTLEILYSIGKVGFTAILVHFLSAIIFIRPAFKIHFQVLQAANASVGESITEPTVQLAPDQGGRVWLMARVTYVERGPLARRVGRKLAARRPSLVICFTHSEMFDFNVEDSIGFGTSVLRGRRSGVSIDIPSLLDPGHCSTIRMEFKPRIALGSVSADLKLGLEGTGLPRRFRLFTGIDCDLKSLRFVERA